MNVAEIKTILNSSEVPFCYDHWNEKPTLPFGVFRCSNSDNFVADGAVFKQITEVEAVLVTEYKSPEIEAKIEQALNDAEIIWQKTETYIEKERIYNIEYSFSM